MPWQGTVYICTQDFFFLDFQFLLGHTIKLGQLDLCAAVAYLGFYFGGGGVQNIFVKVGVSAWQSHAFARGVWGHAPPKFFF